MYFEDRPHRQDRKITSNLQGESQEQLMGAVKPLLALQEGQLNSHLLCQEPELMAHCATPRLPGMSWNPKLADEIQLSQLSLSRSHLVFKILPPVSLLMEMIRPDSSNHRWEHNRDLLHRGRNAANAAATHTLNH